MNKVSLLFIALILNNVLEANKVILETKITPQYFKNFSDKERLLSSFPNTSDETLLGTEKMIRYSETDQPNTIKIKITLFLNNELFPECDKNEKLTISKHLNANNEWHYCRISKGHTLFMRALKKSDMQNKELKTTVNE